MAPTSSSIYSTHGVAYDVFLGFRGEHTCKQFIGHLHTALTKAEISTFRGITDIPRGDEISAYLFKAIEGSRISIVVFFQGYADSTWCLDELVKIMDCRNIGQTVIPLFYNMKPADDKSFAKAFEKHEVHYKDDIEKVNAWRIALKEAINLPGWVHSFGRCESIVIDEVVKAVREKLSPEYSHVAKHLSSDTKQLLKFEEDSERKRQNTARDTATFVEPKPSSSPQPQWSFDVFLSSQGDYSRHSFSDHLYTALKQAGLSIFIYDNLVPKRGLDIFSQLFQGIERSKIAIVVLSKRYVFSSFYLDELAKIMDCKKKTGQTVIPLFYNINPFNVRNQKGFVGKAFKRHQTFCDVNRWRDALKEATNLSGCDLQNIAAFGDESEFIELIVRDVQYILARKYLNVTKHLKREEKQEEEKQNVASDSGSEEGLDSHFKKRLANLFGVEEEVDPKDMELDDVISLTDSIWDRGKEELEGENENMLLDTDPEDNVSHSDEDITVTDSEEEEDDDAIHYMDDGWDTDGTLGGEGYEKFFLNCESHERDRVMKYNKKAIKSKGFELDDSAPPDGFRPHKVNLKDNKNLSDVERLAKHAVNSYNENSKTKGNLEFVRVDHANLCQGYSDMYFITLVAKDTTSQEEKTYQTRVSYLNLIDWENIKVPIFRPRISSDHCRGFKFLDVHCRWCSVGCPFLLLFLVAAIWWLLASRVA